jgi:hypothetical protein
MAMGRSLLGEKGRTGGVLSIREGVFLAKAGFAEELGDAFRGLIHLDGMHLTICAAFADGAAGGTGKGARTTGSCACTDACPTVDLAHAKGPAVEHR